MDIALLLLLMSGALVCAADTANAAAADRVTAPPLTVVLVHLHPPIDFAPHSRLSQQLREGDIEEKTASTNATRTRSAVRERVYRVMSEVVRESQTAVSAFVRQSFQQQVDGGSDSGIGEIDEIEHLWIQNTLVVRLKQSSGVHAIKDTEKQEATRVFFEQTLRWVPGVIDVEVDSAIVRLLDTIPGSNDDGDHREASRGEKPQSNIELLHAPALWAQNVKGKGVVVANIDSGVRYTHEALRDSFRGTVSSLRMCRVVISSHVI